MTAPTYEDFVKHCTATTGECKHVAKRMAYFGETVERAIADYAWEGHVPIPLALAKVACAVLEAAYAHPEWLQGVVMAIHSEFNPTPEKTIDTIVASFPLDPATMSHRVILLGAYKSAFTGIARGSAAGTVPLEDCAIDWPDFDDADDPIHLDTCRVMTGNDEFCTCGLTLLEKAGAKFR